MIFGALGLAAAGWLSTSFGFRLPVARIAAAAIGAGLGYAISQFLDVLSHDDEGVAGE
ncbi:MAG: hypothetical protein ABI165_12760 [Bryobacteraceae bacterium]